MSNHDPVIQRTAPLEQRVDAIQAALDERGMKATDAVEELGHLAQDVWVPQNGARVVARAWVDPAFRERLLADGRSAVLELGLTMPKHHRHLVVLENTAHRPERHLLHAVLVHRLHDHRSAARLVQGPGVPLARRPRVAHGAEGDGSRSAARGGDSRVGHDRGHALHGVAPAAARNRRVAGREACRHRDARCHDRRRLPVGKDTTWTASTIWAAGKASAGSATRTMRPPSTHRGKCVPIRSTHSRCGSESSTWTSIATRSSAWSRAITSRPAITSARSRASRRFWSTRAS